MSCLGTASLELNKKEQFSSWVSFLGWFVRGQRIEFYLRYNHFIARDCKSVTDWCYC